MNRDSDLITALAKLLSSRRLRHEYRHEPLTVSRSLVGDRASQHLLASIEPDSLDNQSAMLVSKRRFEVELLLPETRKALGREQFDHLFLSYADTFWPVTHARHLIDAVEFHDYLQANSKHCSLPVFEIRWLKFRLSASWIRCHFELTRVDGRISGFRFYAFYWRQHSARWWRIGLPFPALTGMFSRQSRVPQQIDSPSICRTPGEHS